MNNSRLRSLFFGAILFAITAAILGYLFTRSNTPSQLQASDIIAGNAQFLSELNQTGDGELNFFTGSALARYDLGDTTGEYVTSKTLSPDVAVNSVDHISRGDGFTVVRSYYNPNETILDLDKNLAEDWNWLIIDDEGNARALPFIDQAVVADCVAVGDRVYVLVRAGSQQDLVSFKLEDKQVTPLLTRQAATTFVGADKDFVVMRDFEGGVYSYNPSDQQVTRQSEAAGEARYDADTNRLVTSPLGEASEDSEGGEVVDASTKLTVRDLASGSSHEVEAEHPYFFVSRGFVLMPDSLARPTEILIHDLKSNAARTMAIDQDKTAAKTPISQMIVVNRDLSLLAVATNQNYLQVYGEASYVDELPVYRLPIIEDSSRYIFDYSVSRSRLDIYAYELEPSFVTDSTDELRSFCRCDTNQLAKSWNIVSDSPGL